MPLYDVAIWALPNVVKFDGNMLEAKKKRKKKSSVHQNIFFPGMEKKSQ